MRSGMIAVTMAAMGVATFLASSAYAADAGDAAKGKQVFNRCRQCHTFDPNGKSHMGPDLYGVVGRKAGTLPGFRYSDPMEKASAGGLVWTPEKLDTWLTDPRAMIPGTHMSFAGLKKAQDRADVIVYLQTASKPEQK